MLLCWLTDYYDHLPLTIHLPYTPAPETRQTEFSYVRQDTLSNIPLFNPLLRYVQRVFNPVENTTRPFFFIYPFSHSRRGTLLITALTTFLPISYLQVVSRSSICSILNARFSMSPLGDVIDAACLQLAQAAFRSVPLYSVCFPTSCCFGVLHLPLHDITQPISQAACSFFSFSLSVDRLCVFALPVDGGWMDGWMGEELNIY